jgi:hypothetical protein
LDVQFPLFVVLEYAISGVGVETHT